jgi:rRNA maturation protein Nop10
MASTMVRMCQSCGSGSKKDQCIKCGNHIGSGGIMARLCNSCGSGSKKDQCIKCGNHI